MEAGAIVRHTEMIGAQLAQRFVGDPKGELDCWVMTAQQREAMVVEIYKVMKLEQRIPDQSAAEAGTVALVREAIGSIWAQESSHVALMSALRKVDAPKQLQAATQQGTIEGLMTSWATSGGVLGTIALAGVGAARIFHVAPPFTEQLGALSLGGFFRFSEALELTASNGYTRILDLIRALNAEQQPCGYGVLSHYEFAVVRAEERFHRAIFERFQRWLDAAGEQLLAQDVGKAAAAIGALAEEHLMISRVPGLPTTPSNERGFREGDSDALVSDGGFAALFERYDVPFRVASPPGEP